MSLLREAIEELIPSNTKERNTAASKIARQLVGAAHKKVYENGQQPTIKNVGRMVETMRNRFIASLDEAINREVNSQDSFSVDVERID